jgi:hypothetical protein
MSDFSNIFLGIQITVGLASLGEAAHLGNKEWNRKPETLQGSRIFNTINFIFA